ncbi:MAG TPA: ATP-binding protein, partial [Bryobacteraceae bacterium]
EVLSRIADANAPIYGLSEANLGIGIVGGYLWTIDGNASKLAELALRVANGQHPRDIPVVNAPDIPIFDWRQLRRWGIEEDRLPPGSIVQFRELTMWQQYRLRIITIIGVIALQTLLIGGLLFQRRRALRVQKELETYKEHLEHLVQERTAEAVEARDQAVAANRSKSIFLANMSHELRTPLNAILGFSDMVLRDPDLADQHRKDLAIVGNSGEHLLGLIDDVLDMAKIETGSAMLEYTSINLYRLVSDAVNMLRDRARAKELELVVDISPRAPRYIRSDAVKLRQVLTNLVGNAVKYTDEGSVAVRLDARPGNDAKHVMLIFDVEDTGLGIAPEDQARVFDPFIQAGGSHSRKGSGLGLSIARKFVELLGGRIELESAPGRGSRFRVEAPAAIAEASEAVDPTPAVKQVLGLARGQRDYRVLIAEDKPENWMLLQRLLESAGFQVRVAEDGPGSVECFQSWRPDFIWMDLRLPVFGGMEAARRIRGMEGGGGVKIAAVTASAFASQRDEVLAAGLDDFVRKPYRPTEIFDCMARHLGVTYVYETRTEADTCGGPVDLRVQELAGLPADLRAELEHAVVSLDSKRIGSVVQKVSEQNAALGQKLATLAEGFAYTTIFEALEGCRNGVGAASV